jgi:hypothetical protein
MIKLDDIRFTSGISGMQLLHLLRGYSRYYFTTIPRDMHRVGLIKSMYLYVTTQS